jgi:hypothetical protein
MEGAPVLMLLAVTQRICWRNPPFTTMDLLLNSRSRGWASLDRSSRSGAIRVWDSKLQTLVSVCVNADGQFRASIKAPCSSNSDEIEKHAGWCSADRSFRRLRSLFHTSPRLACSRKSSKSALIVRVVLGAPIGKVFLPLANAVPHFSSGSTSQRSFAMAAEGRSLFPHRADP